MPEKRAEKMFRFKRGIDVSYEKQGYIHFACRRFEDLSKDRQEAIRGLCREAGGEHEEALFEFVTTQDTATAICQRHFIASRTSLYRVVKRFYESWPDDL